MRGLVYLAVLILCTAFVIALFFEPTGTLCLIFALALWFLLWPSDWDVAIRLKEWTEKRKKD